MAAFSLLFVLSLLFVGVFCSPDFYVPTPVGRLLKSCVNFVPSGSHLMPQQDGSIKVETNLGGVNTIEKCNTKHLPLFEKDLIAKGKSDPFPPYYDGWTAYTAFNLSESSNFGVYNGYFSVPNDPVNEPVQLFFFTSLQNIDWIPKMDPANPSTNPFDIIQPVLQYPANNGVGWSIRSWYVTLDAGAVASEEVYINPGDTVYGVMERVTNSTSWFINSIAMSSGESTSLTVSHERLTFQRWAYNTLECYGCVDCSTYPTKPIHFSKMSMLDTKNKTLTPNWKINPKNNPVKFCHELPIVNDDNTMDIRFQ